MEKHGEIREGITPPERNPDNAARRRQLSEMQKQASELEDHLSKRASDKAAEKLSTNS